MNNRDRFHNVSVATVFALMGFCSIAFADGPSSNTTTIDPSAVQSVVAAHMSEIAQCLTQARVNDPSAGGRLVVRLVIERNGSVSSASAIDPVASLASVSPCITLAIAQWQFPAPNGTGNATVDYPINLPVANAPANTTAQTPASVAPSHPEAGTFVIAPPPTVAAASENGDSLTLLPSPDRVPVIIESLGAPQRISVVTGATVVAFSNSVSGYGVQYHEICETPCHLYGRPGHATIMSAGDGIASANADFRIPASGVRVQLRAAPSGPLIAGFILPAVGVAIALVGGGFAIAAASQPMVYNEMTHTFSHPTDTGLAVTGAVVAGFGVIAIAAGILLLVVSRKAGMQSAEPLAGNSASVLRAWMERVDVNAAPLAGGTMVSARIRF